MMFRPWPGDSSPRGGPRDGFTVFQVEDRSFPSSTVPLNDSACQPCDRGLFDRGHLVDGVPGQLCLVEDDPVHPCPVEHSPVADKQQTVPMRKGRCPGRAQQTTDSLSTWARVGAQAVTSRRAIGGVIPSSSFTSRTTAWVGVSPYSMCPPGISRWFL